MVIHLEDLKTLHILHSDTFPEFRRSYTGQHFCNNIAEGKDEERECDKERARGVVLYLEERYEEENNKFKDLGSFPKEIRDVFNDFTDVFDTKLRKSMDEEPAQFNLKEGSVPSRCYMCRPTTLHYTETANKLVTELLVQRVIGSPWT